MHLDGSPECSSEPPAAAAVVAAEPKRPSGVADRPSGGG